MKTNYDDGSKKIELFSVDKFLDNLNDSRTTDIHVFKVGARSVFNGKVYEIDANGKRKQIGYSWKNTTQTIKEHGDVI